MTEEPDILFHETKQIRQAGRGASIPIPAAVRKRFAARPGVAIDFDVVERGGKAFLEIALPVGFSHEEILAFAQSKAWQVVRNRRTRSGEWSVILKDREAEIRADSWTRSGSDLVNNVFVQSPPISILDVRAYTRIHDLARASSLSTFISDSEGYWTKLTAGNLIEPARIYAPETIGKVLIGTKELLVRLGNRTASLETTLEEIAKWSDRTNQVYSKAIGRGHHQ